MRRRSTEAWLTSAPTPRESQEPQLQPTEEPGPPARQGGGVWREPRAKPPARSGSPASADPDAGAGRSPGVLTLTLLAPLLAPLPAANLLVARPPLPRRPLPGPPQAELAQAKAAQPDEPPQAEPPQADEPPMFAAGSNPLAATTPPPRRQRTADRGWQQDGRLVGVRGDGEAYGHGRGAWREDGGAPGRTGDGGTTRHTDVDKRMRPLQSDSRDSACLSPRVLQRPNGNARSNQTAPATMTSGTSRLK